MSYYLYKITNTINSKLYIGITKNPARRWAQHRSYKSRLKGRTISILYQAMDKYGRDNFNLEVICVGEKDYILDLEVKVIAAYKTTTKQFGYNIKPGGESGRGYTTTNTGRDVPVFVSGWWFPNRRTALDKLNMSIASYKNRQRSGTLGNIVAANYKNGKYQRNPIFVGNFWFPDIDTASEKLGLNHELIRLRIRAGFVGEARRRRDQRGEKNHMFNIAPSEHQSSKRVRICGVLYTSYKEATEATGYSRYIINARLKEGHPDFKRE